MATGVLYDQRAYQCSICNGFHLSKKPERPPQPAKKLPSLRKQVENARKAVSELKRKNVKGAFLEQAEKNLSDLEGKLRGFRGASASESRPLVTDEGKVQNYDPQRR